MVKQWADKIEKEDIIFVGNSMPIRNLKLVGPIKAKVYANRGANGIDGLISTAKGIALMHPEKKVHCLLGDLSFLYDLPSLFQLPTSNLEITIIDNEGARIFERLDQNHPMTYPQQTGIAEKMMIANQNIIIIKPLQRQTQEFWNAYASQEPLLSRIPGSPRRIGDGANPRS